MCNGCLKIRTTVIIQSIVLQYTVAMGQHFNNSPYYENNARSHRANLVNQ
jgi:hypothetical protein